MRRLRGELGGVESTMCADARASIYIVGRVRKHASG